MRYIFLVLIFLTNFLIYSKPITLASYNISKLGVYKKDYNALAKIISKFDIVVIQELIEYDGLERIIENLDNYGYIASKPVGSKNYKEHFAVLYKKDVVDEIKSVGQYPDKNNYFIRPPEAFYIKSNKFDAIIIPVHSIFGDSENQRAFEASKYHKVYEYFKNKTNQDDIILMGDFNLPASDRAFDNLKKKFNLVNVIDPKYRTTISKKGLASSYDNIFINLENLKSFTKRYGVYNYTMNNYDKIVKYVSDHLLIFIELDNERD